MSPEKTFTSRTITGIFFIFMFVTLALDEKTVRKPANISDFYAGISPLQGQQKD